MRVKIELIGDDGKSYSGEVELNLKGSAKAVSASIPKGKSQTKPQKNHMPLGH